jgi:energy-coupling factor transporter ATP-binding protein EcfA2
MRVADLTLTNFRGFTGRQTVALHRDVNVVIGVNGAGKSTMLEALASLLSYVPAALRGATTPLYDVGQEGDIRVGAESAKWSLDLSFPGGSVAHMVCGISLQGPLYSGTFPALLAQLERGGHALPYVGYIHSETARKGRRSPPETPDRNPRLLAYQTAFDPQPLHLAVMETWFEGEENLENEQKIRRSDLGFELPSLRAVRDGVARFMSTLGHGGLGRLQVVRTHVDGPLAPPRGRLVAAKGDQDLFLDQLSDGERRLLLMVADTARRMVVLNPDLPDPLAADGVLLIDEIELHLHPQWQRNVVAAVRAAFPNLQLILATHAPLVLSGVPNESIIVLDGGKVLPGSAQVFGRDPNTILEQVMGTPLRPDDTRTELEALFDAIEHTPTKARKRLKELEKKLGADDPDLVRARALLQFIAA